MLDRFEAFDMLCDKIFYREQLECRLIVAASDGTPNGFLELESWVIRQDYDAEIGRGLQKIYKSMYPAPASRLAV